MSRWHPIAAVCGVAVLALAIALCFVTGSPDPVAPGDMRAAQRLRQLETELEFLRQEVARLQTLVGRPSLAPQRFVEELKPTPPAASREEAEPAARSKAGDPVLSNDDLEWLLARLHGTLGDLTADEALYLRTLDLGGAETTDDDLRHVGGLTHLAELVLRNSSISDAGLANLSGLKRLRHLDLAGTEITSAGLDRLPAEGLRSLHLNDTKITDADFGSLGRLNRLEKLKLDRTQVTDRGMVVLAGMSSLRHVELDQTVVTIAGLRELLRRNPELHRIEARNTGVTAQDAARLLEEFPGREIVVDQGLPLGALFR